MDNVWVAVATLVGAAAGWGCGLVLGRKVAARRPPAFWAAAAGLLVAGTAVAATGGVLGMRPLAFLGFAFAAVALSVLKWVSGHVPGTRNTQA